MHHLRVKMLYSPVNVSDVIPISGAYRHWVTLPGIAGYKGVGGVIEATAEFSSFLGQWALQLAASCVYGVYRSPHHKSKLQRCGITPV